MYRVPSSVRLTNGVSQYIAAAASATINNNPSAMIIMWVKLTTIAPAAQRNFWGKDIVDNRFIGFINATQVGLTYAGAGGGTANASAFVNTSTLTNLIANQPVCLIFTVDKNVSVPKIYAANLQSPVKEATSYTTQTTGTNAAHDDSTAALNVGNAGASVSTNTLPGVIYTFQYFARQPFNAAELNYLTYNYDPNVSGLRLSWRLGSNGTGRVFDDTGNVNHGTLNGGAIPVNEYLPRVNKGIRFNAY